MKSISDFFKKDRRYVFLLGAIMAALNVLMWLSAPSAESFLGERSALLCVLAGLCALFSLMALAAFAVKLCRWRDYRSTFFRRPAAVSAARVLYMLVLASFLITLVDRPLLSIVHTVREAAAAESNPQGFFSGMVYMLVKGSSMFKLGVWTTVRIALLGTAIAFFLAILLVFLRIQKPHRRDNDLVRLLKNVGCGFARVYITVIRGTPMMVQALIFYYAGFAVFRTTGMSITEINHVWSAFISGLITVSLNSTAYLTEVLRGGIESIDAGQTEAARSLGMSSWQAMWKVIFPQAVKNSIPAIGNEFIINIKDSSVLSVIACFDLMFATTSVVGIYYRQLEVYCIAAMIYLILTCLSSLLMRYISKKMDTPARGVPSSN